MGTTASTETPVEKNSVIIMQNSSSLEAIISQKQISPILSIPITDITKYKDFIYKKENTEVLDKFHKLYLVNFTEMLGKANENLCHGFVWFTIPTEDSEKYFARISTIFIGKCAEDHLPYTGEVLKIGIIKSLMRTHICVYVPPPESEIV